MTDKGTTFYPPAHASASASEAPSVGHNIMLVDQQFVIRAQRKAEALSAVQQAIHVGIALPQDGVDALMSPPR
jgi:hypothetical protein